MDDVQAIRAAQAINEGLVLAPPVPSEEIDRLQADIGAPMPPQFRAVLEHTAGIHGGAVEIDFTGRTMDFEDVDVFPSGLPFAADGLGNFWVLDLVPTGASPFVFFDCHDPPVVLLASRDLAGFLPEALRPNADVVPNKRLHEIWRENPGTIDYASALAGDESLRVFAEELGESYTFVDLRSGTVGTGFSWGRFGFGTVVRRHGYERLFACAPPREKPSRLGRLFRR